MAGAVGVAEAGDRLREDLDLAARRRQRLAVRVVAERAQPAAVVGLLRQLNSPRCQNSSKLGAVRPLRPSAGARRLVEMASHWRAVRPSVKASRSPEPLGELGEDVVVVARLAERLGEPVHRDHQRVVGRTADVLALQRHRAGQHDVGMARGGGPGDLVHDQRVDAREGAAQAVDVLVMVERIAAGPVDQPDVRIGARWPL